MRESPPATWRGPGRASSSSRRDLYDELHLVGACHSPHGKSKRFFCKYFCGTQRRSHRPRARHTPHRRRRGRSPSTKGCRLESSSCYPRRRRRPTASMPRRPPLARSLVLPMPSAAGGAHVDTRNASWCMSGSGLSGRHGFTATIAMKCSTTRGARTWRGSRSALALKIASCRPAASPRRSSSAAPGEAGRGAASSTRSRRYDASARVASARRPSGAGTSRSGR